MQAVEKSQKTIKAEQENAKLQKNLDIAKNKSKKKEGLQIELITEIYHKVAKEWEEWNGQTVSWLLSFSDQTYWTLHLSQEDSGPDRCRVTELPAECCWFWEHSRVWKSVSIYITLTYHNMLTVLGICQDTRKMMRMETKKRRELGRSRQGEGGRVFCFCYGFLLFC